jgi:hypothetical protein
MAWTGITLPLPLKYSYLSIIAIEINSTMMQVQKQVNLLIGKYNLHYLVNTVGDASPTW